jgi:hypothetical protein
MWLRLFDAFEARVVKPRLALLSILLLISNLHPLNAFDGSDIEIPRIEQMLLASTIPVKPSEPIAIVLKTSDDKNWVKLEGTLNIGFSYRLIPGRSTPPNCSTVTTSFSRLEAVEILSERITSTTGRKGQTFWLVGFLPAKKELVGNCTEYRDFSQSPIVVLNSTGFRSFTPRGSTVQIINGGVYTPKIIDDSGRFAQTALTARLQESQFLPGTYAYAPTHFCLSYSESSSFREKNKSSLELLEFELGIARDLGNLEGVEISNQALKSIKEVDSWTEFVSTPTIKMLKVVPTCGTPNSPSNLAKVLAELRGKIKLSNEITKRSNLITRCELFQERYLDLERNALLARAKFTKTTMQNAFLKFSYTTLKIDCTSSSITDSLLTNREISLSQSEAELVTLNQSALREVVCMPLQMRIQKFAATYAKLSLKYKGSRFARTFPPKDFGSLFSACKAEPLTFPELELMELEFDQLSTLVSIDIEIAERAYQKKQLKFNFNCLKSGNTKSLTNNTGICPKGWRKI